MSKNYIPPCAQECISDESECDKSSCRMWINYEEDNNCSLISIYKNGKMTLDEVSKRMGVSLVRISQIEKEALNKLAKRITM